MNTTPTEHRIAIEQGGGSMGGIYRPTVDRARCACGWSGHWCQDNDDALDTAAHHLSGFSYVAPAPDNGQLSVIAPEATVAQIMGILLAVPADQRTDVRVLAEALAAELHCTYREISS